VIGILYTSGTTSTFLPTQLVLGVADDLRSTGKGLHGWLGVSRATPPPAGGARGGRSSWPGARPPAAATRVTSSWRGAGPHPLHGRSAGPALRDGAGSTIALSVLDGATTRVVDVTLRRLPLAC
jgi:hypothetical protein